MLLTIQTNFQKCPLWNHSCPTVKHGPRGILSMVIVMLESKEHIFYVKPSMASMKMERICVYIYMKMERMCIYNFLWKWMTNIFYWKTTHVFDPGTIWHSPGFCSRGLCTARTRLARLGASMGIFTKKRRCLDQQPWDYISIYIYRLLWVKTLGPKRYPENVRLMDLHFPKYDRSFWPIPI